jgi:hypothetical protein
VWCDRGFVGGLVEEVLRELACEESGGFDAACIGRERPLQAFHSGAEDPLRLLRWTPCYRKSAVTEYGGADDRSLELSAGQI